ncbi:restriction endonuclease [Oligoflexus tunisiensis]|uniref:restriction endonuclease n=1 Tax=Oligoflexus tunisiensis TaxID=708132 RepID=UPI00114D22D6|nr:restriction endonuclease [Oligoflexus tunisiensis]
MDFAFSSDKNIRLTASDANIHLKASDANISGSYECIICRANLILVGSSSRMVRPHFRTPPGEFHSEQCPYGSKFSLNLDTPEPPSSLLDKQADNIYVVSHRVTLKIIEMFAHNPDKLKTMDRRHFEELVAELFYGFGYKVELTKQSRDGGKDIIAVSHGEIIKQKYLIQCKRPNPGNPIRIGVVRELLGTKADEQANKVLMVTTTYYTKDAWSLARRQPIDLQLHDFDDLVSWLWQYLRIKRGGRLL